MNKQGRREVIEDIRAGAKASGWALGEPELARLARAYLKTWVPAGIV